MKPKRKIIPGMVFHSVILCIINNILIWLVRVSGCSLCFLFSSYFCFSVFIFFFSLVFLQKFSLSLLSSFDVVVACRHRAEQSGTEAFSRRNQKPQKIYNYFFTPFLPPRASSFSLARLACCVVFEGLISNEEDGERWKKKVDWLACSLMMLLLHFRC